CTLSNHLDQPTLDSDFSQLRPPFQAIPVQTNHLTSLYQSCPSSASIRHCSSRELPRNRPGPTVFRKFVGARSPSFLNQIDRVRHQELGRSAKEIFEGSKGDSAEFSAEV
ncbi:F-box and associated interaction domains-containing protein, partial [Prunus dulcis]